MANGRFLCRDRPTTASSRRAPATARLILRQDYGKDLSAGATAAKAAGHSAEPRSPAFDVSGAASLAGGTPGTGYNDPQQRGDKAFVDFQNDVTVKDLSRPRARGSARSSMSNAIRPMAWRPTRARRRTSMPWRSLPTCVGKTNTGGWPDDIPHAGDAGHVRRTRRHGARRAVRPGADDTAA